MNFPVVLAAISALLVTEARSEPCNMTSLVGVWELTAIEAAEPGAAAFYKANPYEYLRFGADSRFIYVTGARKETDIAVIERRLDQVYALDNTRYDSRVVDSQTLIIFRDGRPFQGFQCSVDQNAPGASEMTWTQLPGSPPLRRIQRRLK